MNINTVLEKISSVSDDISRAQMDIESERRIFERKEENLSSKILKLQEIKDDCFEEITSYASKADLEQINVRTILKHLRYFTTNPSISQRLETDEYFLVPADNLFCLNKYVSQIISFDFEKLASTNFRQHLFEALTPIKFPYYNLNSELVNGDCPVAHVFNCEFDYVIKDNSLIYGATLNSSGELFMTKMLEY